MLRQPKPDDLIPDGASMSVHIYILMLVIRTQVQLAPRRSLHRLVWRGLSRLESLHRCA